MDESGLLYGIWHKHKSQKPQVGHSSEWIGQLKFHLELSRYWGGSSWNGKPDGNFSNYHFWFRTRGFNFGCRICYQDSEEKKQNNNSKNFTLTCHLNV